MIWIYLTLRVVFALVAGFQVVLHLTRHDYHGWRVLFVIGWLGFFLDEAIMVFRVLDRAHLLGKDGIQFRGPLLSPRGLEPPLWWLPVSFLCSCLSVTDAILRLL